MNKHVQPPRWFIVKTRPSSDLKAGEEILELGLTVYLPQYRKEYRHHRQNRWVTRFYPLLNGYLFALYSVHWHRVLNCAAVDKVLRSQNDGGPGDPIWIDDATVQAIRLAQEAGDFDELRVHGHNVAVGETVKVTEGALIGLKGAVHGVGEKDITMMLNILGREVKTKAPIEMLGRIG
ncbi:transcription termination/antitermination NusG family protein [Mesorhizobium sp. B2-6-4]|uniref:transcription termination/antitermination protein NusG n=1 Tax=Mesorhizobium sp. B2-6-4 TaxID=2589913 RepID=UPI0015E3881E|nr:transcription termination/antitermination NusG family protein [Mesorhizobium sp. B2-6-4]